MLCKVSDINDIIIYDIQILYRFIRSVYISVVVLHDMICTFRFTPVIPSENFYWRLLSLDQILAVCSPMRQATTAPMDG